LPALHRVGPFLREDAREDFRARGVEVIGVEAVAVLVKFGEFFEVAEIEHDRLFRSRLGRIKVPFARRRRDHEHGVAPSFSIFAIIVSSACWLTGSARSRVGFSTWRSAIALSNAASSLPFISSGRPVRIQPA
jgi:hypothetical protein